MMQIIVQMGRILFCIAYLLHGQWQHCKWNLKSRFRSCATSGRCSICPRTQKIEYHEIPNVYFQQPKDTMRLDETMLVKQLLPEICHFIHTYREGNQHAAELRNSASGVLFSLSCNNFNAVFSRISTRQVFQQLDLASVLEHLKISV